MNHISSSLFLNLVFLIQPNQVKNETTLTCQRPLENTSSSLMSQRTNCSLYLIFLMCPKYLTPLTPSGCSNLIEVSKYSRLQICTYLLYSHLFYCLITNIFWWLIISCAMSKSSPFMLLRHVIIVWVIKIKFHPKMLSVIQKYLKIHVFQEHISVYILL